MKTADKRKLLAEFIELQVQHGYDISNLVGRPLSYFDWTKIQQKIKLLRADEI